MTPRLGAEINKHDGLQYLLAKVKSLSQPHLYGTINAIPKQTCPIIVKLRQGTDIPGKYSMHIYVNHSVYTVILFPINL